MTHKISLGFCNWLNVPEWTIANLVTWAKKWIQELQNHVVATTEKVPAQFQKFTQFLPGNYIDATPFNMIVDNNGRGRFFDIKWDFGSNIPIQLTILRGLFMSLSRVPFCAKPQNGVPHNILSISISILQQLEFQLDNGDVELFVSEIIKFQNRANGVISTNNDAMNNWLRNSQLIAR